LEELIPFGTDIALLASKKIVNFKDQWKLYEKEKETVMFLIGLFMGATFGFVVAAILAAGELPAD
jgi:hypothetical protein